MLFATACLQRVRGAAQYAEACCQAKVGGSVQAKAVCAGTKVQYRGARKGRA